MPGLAKLTTIPTDRLMRHRSTLLSKRNNNPLAVRDALALAAITAELDKRHANR